MEIEESGGLLINDSYQGQRDVIPIYIQLDHVSYPDETDNLVAEHSDFVSLFDKYSSSIEYGGKNY